MDLGKAKFLRTGVNALHQAIHPLHGLTWTDGKQVILTSLHLQNEEPEFGSSVVIGQFEHVHGLYWGPTTDIPALLAVQHKKHVTVWQLYYNPLEKNKLVVSQTCEYGDPLSLLPQGCHWHPTKDILIVLTKRDLSVLYSVGHNNNNVKADITGSSMIRCACWTRDGSRIVAAMDDSLYSYFWNDEDKILSPCSFCPVFNISATVVSIIPIMDYQVAVTSEISSKSPFPIRKELDKSAVQMNQLILDEEFSRKSRRMSVDSGKSEPVDFLRVSPLVPAEFSHILARHRKSDPSPLPHLKQKSISGETKPEISNLVIVSFEKNATTMRKVSLPGLTTPDILVLDSHCERVAVASNTSSLILIYPIAPSCMPNIQQIKLEENERAKGLCFLTNTLLLIMAGRQRSNDMTFLPISISEKYMLQLLTKKIMPIEYVPSRLSCGPMISDDSIISVSNKQFYDDHNVTREFWMPSDIGSKSPCLRRKLRDIARGTSCDPSPMSSLDDYNECKVVSESAHPVTLENFQTEPTIRRSLNSKTGNPNKTPHKTLSCQRDSEDPKERCISTPDKDGSTSPGTETQDSDGFPNALTYPSSEDPPYISVTHQKTSDEEVADIRNILLCHGKLHLKTVREIFQLQNIEMMSGTKWIVLTEDGDGFAPVIFQANQEVIIREANEPSASPVSVPCNQWPGPEETDPVWINKTG
ncbi:WD repeat and coiled-coil-containing protein-like [Gastrophryne carolinensis]